MMSVLFPALVLLFPLLVMTDLRRYAYFKTLSEHLAEWS